MSCWMSINQRAQSIWIAKRLLCFFFFFFFLFLFRCNQFYIYYVFLFCANLELVLLFTYNTCRSYFFLTLSLVEIGSIYILRVITFLWPFTLIMTLCAHCAPIEGMKKTNHMYINSSWKLKLCGPQINSNANKSAHKNAVTKQVWK